MSIQSGQLHMTYPVLLSKLSAIPVTPTKSFSENVVPKNSPRTSVNYLSPKAIRTLPQRLPLLPKGVSLPLVRLHGVKKTIKDLAKIFNLKYYDESHILFWYLDTLADFLWRLQDDYQLPLEFQRIGLSWIIFFLSILIDLNINYNREEIFEILRETIMLAGEAMDEGDPYLARPEKLAQILTIEDCCRLDQMEQALSDSENVEIDYLDLRTPNNRGLLIMKPSVPSNSSSETSSKSTMEYSSSIMSILTKNSTITWSEEESIADSDELELEQNADMEKLSVKTMLAVIDFIFEYFHNDFQYSLIRSAVINPPNYFEQTIEEFHFPKKFSEEEDQSIKSEMSMISFRTLLDALQSVRGYKKNLMPLRKSIELQSSFHSYSSRS